MLAPMLEDSNFFGARCLIDGSQNDSLGSIIEHTKPSILWNRIWGHQIGHDWMVLWRLIEWQAALLNLIHNFSSFPISHLYTRQWHLQNYYAAKASHFACLYMHIIVITSLQDKFTPSYILYAACVRAMRPPPPLDEGAAGRREHRAARRPAQEAGDALTVNRIDGDSDRRRLGSMRLGSMETRIDGDLDQ
jgi:hypothetical protein